MTATNSNDFEPARSGQLPNDTTWLQQVVERYGLDVTHRVGANDLLGIWRGSSKSLKDFTASVEHLAWYMKSDDAKGINHPKA